MKKIKQTVLVLVCMMVPMLLMGQHTTNEKKAGNDTQPPMTEDEAVKLVRNYYEEYSTIARNKGRGDVSLNAQLRLLDTVYFANKDYKTKGEMLIPNELRNVSLGRKEGEGSGSQLCQPIRSVSNNFIKLSQNGMTFSYEIVGKPELRQMIVESGDASPMFAVVRVKKEYKYGNRVYKYIDTVGVHLSKRGISTVNNEVYPAIVAVNDKDATSDQLQMEALAEYGRRNLDQAYSLLQKALKKDPTDEDVSYQLGVMSYKGQGCRQYNRRIRDYMTEFYWYKSKKGRTRLHRGENSYCDIFEVYSGLEYDPFPCNRMLIVEPNGKKCMYGFMSKDGHRAIRSEYAIAFPFMTNGTAVAHTKDWDWVLIDTLGKIKEVFSDGFQCNREKNVEWCDTVRYLYLMGKDSVWGCMDRITGEWLSPLSKGAKQIFSVLGVPIAYTVKEKGMYGLRMLDRTNEIPATKKNILVLPCIEGTDSYWKYREERPICRWLFVLCNYDENKLQEQLKKKSKPVMNFRNPVLNYTCGGVHIQFDTKTYEELKEIGEVYIIPLGSQKQLE